MRLLVSIPGGLYADFQVQARVIAVGLKDLVPLIGRRTGDLASEQRLE